MTYEWCGAACLCDDPCGLPYVEDTYDPEHPGPCAGCEKDMGCRWGECAFMLDKDQFVHEGVTSDPGSEED